MSKKPLIVGLNSIRGKTGKDTIVQYASFGLSQDYAKLSMPAQPVKGLKAVRFAFGDALKDECAEVICGFSPEMKHKMRLAMDNQSLKDTPMAELRINQMPNGGYRDWLYDHTDFDRKVFRSPRFHLQQFGNGYVRNFHNNKSAWLDIVKTKIAGIGSMVDVIFITDMRQRNEAEWIKETGGLTVLVSRDWNEPEVDDREPHETDLALVDWPFDHYILNKKGHVTEAADVLSKIIREKLDA